MAINLMSGHTTEERYIHTIVDLPMEQWMEAPEGDLIELIDGFCTAPCGTNLQHLTPYNLDHHSTLMDTIRDKVERAACGRGSLALMQTAMRISDRKANHLWEWIQCQERQQEERASLEQQHIQRIAEETAEDQAELMQWIG